MAATHVLDQQTLARLRRAAPADGGPVVLTDSAGRPVFTLAGPPADAPAATPPDAPADGERADDEPDEALLRLADYIESLPEDPYKDLRTDETTAEMLRRAARGRGRVTTATQIIAEAARREREARGDAPDEDGREAA